MIKVDRSILVRSMRDKAFQTVGIPFTKADNRFSFVSFFSSEIKIYQFRFSPVFFIV